MNKRHLIVYLGILLSSCSINLYRPIDTNIVNLDNEEQIVLKKTTSFADTVLILRKSDCQINSDDYLIMVYKHNGLTKSKAFSTSGNYPIEPIIEDFNWNNVFRSLDSITYQKAKPSYHGRIIEGDTTWQVINKMSGEQVWNFKIYTKADTTFWETVSTERQANPSMAKTKVSEYILSETYNKTFSTNLIYGVRKCRKKPIIGRK